MHNHTLRGAIVVSGLCLLGWKQAAPQSSASDSQRAAAQACLANMKQLGIAVTAYAQDHDILLPRKDVPLMTQTRSYVKNDQAYHCPLDAAGVVSYTFNASMFGVSLASVEEPARTVLLYEGKNRQLNFRHEGRAIVSFADGHARLITPDEAKTVYWYAGGKTPRPAARSGGKNRGKTEG